MADPPNATKDLGVQAPSYREQRPYIAAFREFIRNPQNKTASNRIWTPTPVLENLWELWAERPKAFHLAQFKGEHLKTIERLRSNSPQIGLDSSLLFELIKRFLTSQGISTPRHVLLKAVQNGRRALIDLLPPIGWYPVRGEEHEAGIRLYELVFTGTDTTRFFAIKSMEPEAACCPAILFTASTTRLELGLYFFSTRECYMRSTFSDREYGYQRYIVDTVINVYGRPIAIPEGHAEIRPAGGEVRPDFGTESYKDAIDNFGCTCERSTNEWAMDVATRYFKNFDL